MLGDPRKAFQTALGFEKATRILESIVSKKANVIPEAIPFAVNCAISAELYLKCLHMLNGQQHHVHDLYELFKKLNELDRDRIEFHYHQYMLKFVPLVLLASKDLSKNATGKMIDALKSAKNVFVDWRYNFEGLNDSQTLPVAFLFATRETILEKKPEWKNLPPDHGVNENHVNLMK